jgi:molybdenum cofactor cytidylyltransferase
MIFGRFAPRDALGATLAHGVVAGAATLRKGHVIGPDEVATLEAAAIAEIVVARLEPGDVGEDAAAARLAARLAGPGVRADEAFTGRVNMFAESPGVLLVDPAAIDAFNAVDEAITLATLPRFAAVEAGRMVATVKIIPFAVPGTALDAALSATPASPVALAPFRLTRFGMIQTVTGATPEKVLDKTRRVTETRAAAMGATLMAERRVNHEAAPLAEALAKDVAAGAELLLVFGASAISDRRDVIPEAIERAGGRVIHLGMPVDPGNLMLVGEIAGRPVLGAPGCARSPKENGFDWVLARLAAGLAVTRADIMGLGVGGLLMEIVSRPQPRAEKAPSPEAPRVAGILLVAGRSTRFGGPNKLLQEIGGVAVVRRAAEALLAGGVAELVVVTGHMAAEVEAALAGLAARFVHNPTYAEGLSTSLAVGVSALHGVEGALVALGDMPAVGPDTIRALLTAFAAAEGKAIVLPSVEGKRGNPVIWPSRFFADLKAVQGDVGARHLIGANAELIVEVPVWGLGTLTDVDTPEALDAARAAHQTGALY